MGIGFWGRLRRPILALAPMANVTDAAFRRIIAKYGKPAVIFTEFVSADGLLSAGRERLLVDLRYSEGERPIVAQLFSGTPESMFRAAKLVRELGFDGVDINMGCPDRAIEKSGAGAALMKNPPRARMLIRAAQEGARPLPVSVKTRLGYHRDTLEEWLPALLAEEPAAVTIHARTRKEMSKVPARWERVRRAVEIRDAQKSRALILGNGDVASVAEARRKTEETGADGIMVGRAIFGRPWLFAGGGERLNLSPDPRFNLEEPPLEKRLRIMLEHTKLFEEIFRGVKSFAIMRKHFTAYVAGFKGARELRMRLMEAENAAEVTRMLETYLRA